METHGPLGTLWVGIGLGAFYIALVWINTLLGIFTGPLFMVPMTWVLDRVQKRPIGAGGLIRAESAARTTTVVTTEPVVVTQRTVVR
jgi:hypothetical protein